MFIPPLPPDGGIQSLNGLLGDVQTFAVGTGNPIGWSSSGSVHTLNLPDATASIRGVLTSTDWSTFNNKVSSTRSINTTSPLSGGGDLSSDRTITTSMATGKLIGRSTAGTGVMEEISPSTGLSLSAGSLSVSNNSTIQKVEVVKNSGAVVGTRKQLNFIEGSNVTLTVSDDSGNDQVDITIASTGGGGGITVGTTTITSGTNTRIPFNDSGVYQEDSNLTWDKTNDYLTVNTAILSRPSTGTVYLGSFPASIVSPNNGTAFGLLAGSSVTSATNFFCAGYQAGNAATTQQSFVYIGANAGLNAVGTRNFGAGASALANNSGTDCYALGSLSMVNATGEVGSIFIGTNTGTAASTGFYQTFIGDACGTATGASWGNTHIGARGGQTVGTGGFGSSRNVSIGYLADIAASITSAVAIGAGAVASTSNTIVLGGTITAPTRMYIGLGETSATPTNITISPTNAVGTSISGANLILAGSQPTGSGVQGNVVIATSTPGSSGTTLRALTNRAQFSDVSFEELTHYSFHMPYGDGTSGEPTYGFGQGYSDFGMYLERTGDDAIAFATLGTKQFQIDQNGNLRTYNLHDNATAQGDATEQDLRSGTYTPTLTGVANVSASTARKLTWSRVGNHVTVDGQLDIDPTTTLTLTQLGISLPVASNFGTAYECGGSGVSKTGNFATIEADATNNRAQLEILSPVDVTNQTVTIHFGYEVI